MKLKIQNSKLKIFFLVIIFCAVFGVSAKASASTYYVKNGGNDSLSGLDDANAWETIAKVQSSVTSGDTVYFRSQDTWTSSSTVVPLLRATEGVTYDGSAYGSGTRAVLQASTGFTGDATNELVEINVSDVSFNNFSIDGNQINTTGISVGYSASLIAPISNIIIENCKVFDLGNPANLSAEWMYGILISSRTDGIINTDISILDSEVYSNYHEGIAIYPSWNSTGNGVDRVLIRNCKVHDNGTDVLGTGVGMGIAINNNSDNVTVEYCALFGQADGISIRTSPDGGVGNGGPNNMLVRYNELYDNDSGILIQDNYSQILSGSFYGNIIYNNSPGISVSNANYSSSVFSFYNNTIYNDGSYGTGMAVAEYGGNIFGTPVFNFKNNIIYTSDSYAVDDRHHWLTHSSNLIYRSDGSSLAVIRDAAYDSIPISSTVVTVSIVGDYMYFTKVGGGDWTSLFSVGNFVKWTGFSSPDLNGSLFYIYEVSANYLKVYRDEGGNMYSDVNTVAGEKWVASTYDRSVTTVWEPTAQNTDPQFTGGTLPTGFSGTYGANIVPNTDYFKITSGNALNNGATLGSPYDGNINTAGTDNPIARLAGAYDIGAYEYQGADTTAPGAPSGLAVE